MISDGRQILALLQDRRDVLRNRFAVSRVGLFGSWARNEAVATSDVDILVTFDQPTFDHYMDLKFYLEDLLKCRVDLVMESALRPRLRDHVLREVRYAA